MTFFSIIIPTYNRADLIKKTIDSVLAQSYNDFELIIVDDGSIDNTKTIIEKKYSGNRQVRYFYRQNEERAAARNFGLTEAKGDYAVFFDSDDLMKPNYLKTLSLIIKENPEVLLLATKYNYLNNDVQENHPELARLAEGWYDQRYFLKGNILACNYSIKIKNNSFNLFPPGRELSAMEDWLFLLSNLEKKKIFIKDEICLSMRQHDGRSMRNNKKVIAARKKATHWVLSNLSLSDKDKKTLTAWSHYFCAVHQYLDYNRKESIREILHAVKEGGIQFRFFILFLKSIIGRKFIKRLR